MYSQPNSDLLEWSNPIPKSPERKASTKVQIKMGIISLFSLLLYTTIWLWRVDRHLPFYGYWAGRENEFGLGELVLQIFIYMFCFDTWFYLTHHFLHIEWLMQHVHRFHHV
jgi:Delta7-sterol 5-desaturase